MVHLRNAPANSALAGSSRQHRLADFESAHMNHGHQQQNDDDYHDHQDSNNKNEQPPPPPRKEKQKHQEQQQNKKKKKRAHDDNAHASASTSVSAANLSTVAGSAGFEEEDDEAEDETEDEADSAFRPAQKRKLQKATKKHKKISAPASTTQNPRRIVLRLPNPANAQSGKPGNAKKLAGSRKNKKAAPADRSSARLNPQIRVTPSNLTNSPQSSVDSDAARALRAGEVSDLDLVNSNLLNVDNYPFMPRVGTNEEIVISDDDDEAGDEDMSEELTEDDEEDMEQIEEKRLIERELVKMQKKRKSNSPITIYDDTVNSADEEEQDEVMELISSTLASGGDAPSESLLFEIARVPKSPGKSRRLAKSPTGAKKPDSTSGPWSAGEESLGDLDDLDELLGLTNDDTTMLVGHYGADSGSQPIKFEDFLGLDDGDSSSFSSTGDETDSEDSGNERDIESTLGMNADQDGPTETEADDEHISTTKAVVQNGGFIFFKPGVDDVSSSDESGDENRQPKSKHSELSEYPDIPEEHEDEGETTDTLSDSDQLGLIKFGIEMADEDDEDITNMLQTSLIERHIADARNLGISVSIDSLVSNPEAVIAQTAKSLSITKETAAKILTSIGMAMLLNNKDEASNPPANDKGKGKEISRVQQIQGRPKRQTKKATPAQPVPSTSTAAAAPSTASISKSVVVAQQKPSKPIMGDFSPAGGADLCIVVGEGAPTPSPFSARKKRKPTTLNNGSPAEFRGQSVSSVSAQSVASMPAFCQSGSNSSEEQHTIYFDLDDFLDVTMLPSGQSEGSEEEGDDIDDNASVSTTNLNGGLAVGDVSRWDRVPIGAFRRNHNQEDEYTSLASAIFSGTRDPIFAHNLSLHGGVSLAHGGRKRSSRNKRNIIPVSPVLFPIGQSLKAISSAKSRKERRKDHHAKKTKSGLTPKTRLLSEQLPSSAANKRDLPSFSPLNPDQKPGGLPHTSPTLKALDLAQSSLSLPSDGLTHYVSPLFKGVAGNFSIPPLTL